MKNIFYKKLIVLVNICLLYILYILNYVYAGNVENKDGFMMYRLANGEYAKDTWCFVDFNGDSIRECYRFDEYGHIKVNFISEDGRKTNDKGQLVENGFVVEKMSNGKIRYGEGEPFVDIDGTKNFVYKSPTDNKKHPNSDIENKGVIKTVEITESFIGPVAPAISKQIIYSKSAGVTTIDTHLSDLNENTNKQNKIVVGKNIDNFIDKKVKCKIEKDDCVIYGGITWDDCIELSGTGATVSFNIKNNNYMSFEVAEESHVADEKDINLCLEVYVDNELFDTLDEFIEGEPQEFNEELFDAKKVELRVKSNISTSRRVYIHNGRFKKVKEDE